MLNDKEKKLISELNTIFSRGSTSEHEAMFAVGIDGESILIDIGNDMDHVFEGSFLNDNVCNN